jgi:hypothetical protein
MTDRYYYELDRGQYVILEESGGGEYMEYCDISCFWVCTLEDAQEAVEILNNLYRQVHDR